MEPQTHLGTDSSLSGNIVELAEGRAVVELETIQAMTVDVRGLVHGGFVFSLADYAAMLAVNDPHVVLGSADVRFLRPVVVGERVVATARVLTDAGRKREVQVEASVRESKVFEGVFVCFVLAHHVLDKAEDD